ncbi:MAG: glycosyl transferase family 2 [bacterium]|nr:MAG: glycosyl transferase family 2 [bacterium]
MNAEEVLVIVPAYNEEKALPHTLSQLVEIFDRSQIVVINDGSADGTSVAARRTGVRIIDLAANMGIGVAMQTGYKFAVKNGFRYAIQCDGDGQHPPREIPAIMREMERTGADMVIGSRFLDTRREGFKSYPFRRAAIRLFSAWINMLTRLKVYDVTSGFRLANEKVIRLFAREYPFDYPEPESIILLTRRRFKVVEVAVSMRQRQGGVSSIGFSSGLYYMVKVMLGLALTKLRKEA